MAIVRSPASVVFVSSMHRKFTMEKRKKREK
jgi:hypothetical protein